MIGVIHKTWQWLIIMTDGCTLNNIKHLKAFELCLKGNDIKLVVYLGATVILFFELCRLLIECVVIKAQELSMH